MEQIKIGKFISAMRKEQNLTQRQLADQLDISDKTVSKWECGKGLPEVSLMIPLCEILEINVNELLSGERLTDNTYHERAEENMMNLIREKEESRKKIILSTIIALLCTSVLIVCILIVGYIKNINLAVQVSLVTFGVLVFVIGLCIAILLDREAGTFECPKCQARFTPDVKSYVFGPHTITKRYLKCPNCGESNYCRHRLN